MIADRSVLDVIAPLRSRCSVCLEVCRMCRAWRKCWNCGIQRWFADTARGKVCDFAFLTFSRGKFYEIFMTVALAIPPLTVKNSPCALIRACALNRKNTVCYLDSILDKNFLSIPKSCVCPCRMKHANSTYAGLYIATLLKSMLEIFSSTCPYKIKAYTMKIVQYWANKKKVAHLPW